MELVTHTFNNKKIAELVSEKIEINNVQDALDLMGNAGYHEINNIILHEKHLHPDFFDLKTGFAGEVLQKFTNYRIRLAIIGDFTKYTSKSLRDFILESNKYGRIMFLPNREEAIKKLTE